MPDKRLDSGDRSITFGLMTWLIIFAGWGTLIGLLTSIADSLQSISTALNK